MTHNNEHCYQKRLFLFVYCFGILQVPVMKVLRWQHALWNACLHH